MATPQQVSSPCTTLRAAKCGRTKAAEDVISNLTHDNHTMGRTLSSTAATYSQSMDTTGFSSVFREKSISVYFNLANDDYAAGTTTQTECNFILNGTLEKSYVHTPFSKKGMEYNVEVLR
ncbi:hypothetical protein AAF712_010429 [Marasmius tenuissimus]|uniref:Uncharacterized protein n=1 Tax=Marasmius tenuissimus TaxID=585030 RepID=A0ABR2ZQK3_9AGAR